MIKVAFFDFDDTLLIHRRRHLSKDYEETRLSKMFAGKFNYDGSVVPRAMHEFVISIYEHNVQLFCLSFEKTSIPYHAKKRLLMEKYEDSFVDVLITGNNPDKITVMKSYIEAKGLRPDEVLFIDDKIDNVTAALNEGITAISTVEILSSDLEYLLNDLGLKEER